MGSKLKQYRKEAMNQYKKLIQNLSKKIKSDNFCYRKVGRAITKWGAIEIHTQSTKKVLLYTNAE